MTTALLSEVAPSIKGLAAQPLTLSDLESRPHSLGAPILDGHRPQNPLHQVKATLTVCVGQAEVTVGELLGAKEHQVLRLDRTVDRPVDILLEGQTIARGTLVAVGDYFGVRITELPLPLHS